MNELPSQLQMFIDQKRARHLAHIWVEGKNVAEQKEVVRKVWPTLAKALDLCVEQTGVIIRER